MTSACFSRGHTGFSRNATLVATVNPPALAGGVFNLAEAFLSSGQSLLTSLEAHWLFGCPLLGPDAIGLLAEALAVMSPGYGHLPALLLGGIVPGSRRARELYACCESLFTIYLAGE